MIRIVLLAHGLSLALMAAPALANESPKALQDAFVAALTNNDAEGLAACYADHAVNFPVGELIGRGPDSVRQTWRTFFESYTVLSVELSEDQLVAFGDRAAAWGLFSLTVEPVGGGEPIEMVGRYMDVAENFDGVWLYIADHASVPAGGGKPTESE